MILQQLTLLNFKNIQQAELTFSPNVNCFIGNNGMGKTNVLDAIYFLSIGKSSSALADSQCVQHGAEYMMIQGAYLNQNGDTDQISCAMKLGQRKRMRRNDKEYKRLREHLGVVPLVMISPADQLLITGGSEERRKFMDVVISQTSPQYVEALVRYNKSLQQRNALLKSDTSADPGLFEVLEEMMSADAEVIFHERSQMLQGFTPIFSQLYAQLCNTDIEAVDIQFETHGTRGSLLPQLQQSRAKEQIVGYTLHGPHKDNLTLLLNGHNIRQEGSQGQSKTFFIAMKLAQFIYLKQHGAKRTPILLLDDIFDKLDAGRVACIVDYVSSDAFGQIFITDTNRDHLDQILQATDRSYKLFEVSHGNIEEKH